MGQQTFERRGLMLILSSPSGAGKTSISRALFEKDSNFFLSISVTTRPKRPSEQDGRDYFFVSEAEFQSMIKKGEFIEYAHVFGYHYGTPLKPIQQALSAGQDVLFDIDWQGTQQLSE
ncbi:MAG: guanylate kinase, partial [Pseudomonadota bacterium]